MSKQTRFAPEDEVIGCIPLQLDEKHAKEIMALAEGVENFEDIDNLGTNLSRFTLLVELYHFEPSLLDSILVKLLDTIVNKIHFPDKPDTGFSHKSLLALILLKRLTTVRGYKTVIQFLPHEVFVLPKLLSILELYVSKENLNSLENEAINMLLIWFIIVCRNPFDFHSFAGKGEKSYPDRIRDCLNALRFTFGKYACLTLAETLTRHADNTEILKPEIENCLTELKNEKLDFQRQISNLQLLSMIFKKGKRPELQKYGKNVFEELKISMLLSSENAGARQHTVKLLQRIALIYLKPKPAAWRYKCGVRSLEENLKATSTNKDDENIAKNIAASSGTGDDEGEEEDISDMEPELERFVNKILAALLQGISDNDNFVRASSAKGIGRIAARIPQAFADCLVEKVFATNFTPMSSAGDWHGGCMAVAEFSQRGCILPKRLPFVMELVCKALEFDDSAKATAVNVRDAACYISWAFARGFGKDTLDYEILKTLAFKLVSTALFDRSVNVRRAAGAAFQENVGRNIFSKETNKFPEGIVLSTMIDYQAVARIETCYSSLCLEVANFGKYVHPMMESLLNVFSGHWDEKIRLLAADAIQGLVKFDALYSVNILIPKFYEKLITSTDVDVKQGSLLCLGSILKGLHESRMFKVTEIDLHKIKELIPSLTKTYHSAIKHGSLLMLKAIGSFVEAFAATKLPLNDEELSEWHRIADRIIGDLNPQVRIIGKKAIKNIMEYYVLDIDRSRKFMNVVKEYFPKLEAQEHEFIRVGAAIALGGIPAKLLKENIFENKMLAIEIVERLLIVVEDEKFVHWVDARVAALNSIERIVSKVGISHFDIPTIFACLKRSIRDNTKTIQGLVGQFVRCASISAFIEFLPLLEEAKLLKQETLDQIISLILEQCCERIDKLREFSAFQLRDLLQRHVLSNITEREKLYSIFVNQKDIKWMVDAFEPLAPLLDCEFYHESILRGFINSIGGATGSWTQEKGLVKLEQFYRNNPEKADQLFQVFLNIFDEHQEKLIQLIIPVTAFGRLFSEGCFSHIEQEPDKYSNFVEVVKRISKLAYGGPISVRNAALSSLATVFQTNLNSEIFKLASTTLIALLSSKIPVIRSEAAKCFAQAVNVLDVTNDIPMEELQQIYSLLKETQWRDNESSFKDAAKIIRNEFTKVIEKHQRK